MGGLTTGARMPEAERGVFVVLEGIDGAGTTTQARLLIEALDRPWITAIHGTCEPSSGPIGQLLRAILAGGHAPVDATTMALLFAADRADHLAREIEPALARGAVVVSDRYYHSSLAYQGSEEEAAWVRVLNQRARRPDLTVLLDVDPEVAARRRTGDARPVEIYDHLETQKRVAAAYREVARSLAPRERIEILDGTQPVIAIAARIRALVYDTCSRRGLQGP